MNTLVLCEDIVLEDDVDEKTKMATTEETKEEAEEGETKDENEETEEEETEKETKKLAIEKEIMEAEKAEEAEIDDIFGQSTS